MARDPRQMEMPIQPVDNPVICSPYKEPAAHWVYDTDTGEATRWPGRRPAGYWYKTQQVGTRQRDFAIFQEEERDDLPLVNKLRNDVRRWRESNYRNATNVTRELLRHWAREDLLRRLFFCQREAVETIIYLVEIRTGGKRLGFQPQFTDEDLQELVDKPNEPGWASLIRYGCKMATGSGKTVVMAMLNAWAFCNHGKVPSDRRFPSASLVVCPNLTVKERLQVLRPENEGNYYDEFELIPHKLRPLLNSGKVLVTNWHLFLPESPHTESGQSYAVVNKGEETPDAFAQRVLGDLYDRAPIMVLNDEGHHAYRPAPVPDNQKPDAELTREERQAAKAERDVATVWISGIDRIHKACGVQFCMDLSATPFYIQGSGHVEGKPFPWLVSDFGLVDAIESGITKIPRLPVSDSTGRPEPKYFRLWEAITENLKPSERLPGRAGKPKPEVVYREVEDALTILASQWHERFHLINEAVEGQQDKTPPVMIVVCDNTDIAELFHQNISGEGIVEVIEEGGRGKRRKKPQTRTTYGQGKVFPDLLSNTAKVQRTMRIDSKLLAEAESSNPGTNRQQAAEELRQIVATVGKSGQPGEQIRCVVSVAMLTEGWDANNVTHILGLRAFGSQLLCEQVVGRGLRRMDYTPDPETGLLTEEYVDVYGIPFSVIPFKGRAKTQPAPEDKPKNHVHALTQRELYEMRFPVIEGYAFALRKNAIKADIAAMEPLFLDPEHNPTAVYVKPTVGYQVGPPQASGPGELGVQTRDAYYASTHLQTIKFEIARQIVWAIVGDYRTNFDERSNPKVRLQSRHLLFPQVLQLVEQYIRRRVHLRGCDPREIGQERYVMEILERLVTAIEPDESHGEVPLMPILNRYKPIGTSKDVNFKTTRTCHPTQKSHVNLVAQHSGWEGIAASTMDASEVVEHYVRNDHMGLMIPYEFMGISHSYEPDFLVKLSNGTTLVLEIKGLETEQDRSKYEGAKRWVSAVNNWSQMGVWGFHVCRDPYQLREELKSLTME